MSYTVLDPIQKDHKKPGRLIYLIFTLLTSFLKKNSISLGFQSDKFFRALQYLEFLP